MRRVCFKGKFTSHTLRKVPVYMSPYNRAIDSREFKNMDNRAWRFTDEKMVQLYGKKPETPSDYITTNRMFHFVRGLYYNDSEHVHRERCPACGRKCEVSKVNPKGHKSWKKTKGLRASESGEIGGDFSVN